MHAVKRMNGCEGREKPNGTKVYIWLCVCVSVCVWGTTEDGTRVCGDDNAACGGRRCIDANLKRHRVCSKGIGPVALHSGIYFRVQYRVGSGKTC